MKKKNLVFTIIALVSVVLLVLATVLSNKASLPLALVGATALFVVAILKWIVPAKKNKLFRIIVTFTLYLLVLSWIIPAASASSGEVAKSEIYRMSFYSILEYPYLTFQYFLQPLLFILAVGGLYGVLAETGKYRNILEKIAKSMKGKEKAFLIIITFLLAAINSVCGLNLTLFIFMPALVAIILLLGYDKLTAFLSVFIAPLIGIIGSTYNYQVTGYINEVIGTDFSTELVAKIGLFVLSYVVFAFFLLKHADKSKSKVNEFSEQLELAFLGEKRESKKSTLPIVIIFAILFVILVLGYVNFNKVFNVTFFDDLHTKLTEWSIKDYTILAYIIGDIKALGTWSLEQITIMVVLASILLSVIYNINLDNSLKAFGKGVKNVIRPALMVIVAYFVLLVTAYHPFIITITDAMVGVVKGVSGTFGNILFIVMSVINTFLSTILNLDMIYLVQSTVPFINSNFNELSSSLAVITQSIYGLTLLVAPTSVFMVLGLEYLDISYKDWLKNSWKMLLALFAVILVIICVVVFI